MFLTVFDTFLTDQLTDRPTDRPMKGGIEAPRPELKNICSTVNAYIIAAIEAMAIDFRVLPNCRPDGRIELLMLF